MQQEPFGVFTRAQAMEAGLTPQQLRYRVVHGHLLELFPGVYLPAGSPVTWEQHVSAALSWTGPLSAAAGSCAAAIWELRGFSRERIEVVTSRRLRCPDANVLVRHACLTRSDIRVRGDLRVTSPERTLFDLARCLSPRGLENAIDDAIGRRLTTLDRVDQYSRDKGARGVQGTKLLKKTVQELRRVPGADVFERMLFKCLASRGLPPPCAQFPVQIGPQRYYLDYAYPDLLIGIEAHSFKYHSQRPDWERDQLRHNALTGVGWNMLYITWRQLRDHPDRVAASIASARSSAENLLV